MKNKRLWLVSLVIAFVMLTAFLAGCSSSTTTPTASITTTLPSTTPPASAATTVPPATTSVAVTTTPPTTTTLPPTTTATQAPAVTLNISAAASLTAVLKEIDALYTQANSNVTLTPSFGASGTLQTQIENGAPCDIFISAAAAQMNNLEKANLIITDTRKNLLNNTLVMIVPNDSTLHLTGFKDITADNVTKVAIGDPKSVPAGTYAQKAFDEFGITAQVQSKLVLGANVTQVLNYVESGNVDVGFVYSTDALTSSKVKVVANAPADINAQIIYPVAVLQASKNPDAAKAYLKFLSGDQAKALFLKYGFTMVVQ